MYTREKEEKMSLKNILKPTWKKVIAVILIFVILYFYLLSNIKVSYVCSEGGEKCAEETQSVIQKLAFQDTLIIGIPFSIIAWIIIGVIETNKRRGKRK